MPNYKKIWSTIVSIMNQDYAGKDEKKDWVDIDFYRNKLNNAIHQKLISEEIFYDFVDSYLASYKDNHILWRHKDFNYARIGFKARRYKNKLYVTAVLKKDIPIKKGQIISEIDGFKLDHYEKCYPYKFKDVPHERQMWQSILQRAKNITIQDGKASTKTIDIIKDLKYDLISKPYEILKIDNKILYLRFDDFNNPDLLYELFESHKEVMQSTLYWIIDVRNNSGGSDHAYQPLLPYIFKENENLHQEDVYLLMSKRNRDLRIHMLKQFIKQGSHKEETRIFIENYIKEIEAQTNYGFVKQSTENNQLFDNNHTPPERIIVLTDVYCSSSGDQFVQDCKQAQKVQVIGRPTLGVLDYSNLAKIDFEGIYELWYPTSKTANTINHQFIIGGIKPDVYIPWTPKHLTTDFDLQYAIATLSETQ